MFPYSHLNTTIDQRECAYYPNYFTKTGCNLGLLKCVRKSFRKPRRRVGGKKQCYRTEVWGYELVLVEMVSISAEYYACQSYIKRVKDEILSCLLKSSVLNFRAQSTKIKTHCPSKIWTARWTLHSRAADVVKSKDAKSQKPKLQRLNDSTWMQIRSIFFNRPIFYLCLKNLTFQGPSRSLLPSITTSGRPPTPVMLRKK